MENRKVRKRSKISDRWLSVLINCPKREEAKKILDLLLEKRIVAGGLTTHGPSRYFLKWIADETI
jgi:uncharacterized protein involved in tolerance to divalent cations